MSLQVGVVGDSCFQDMYVSLCLVEPETSGHLCTYDLVKLINVLWIVLVSFFSERYFLP